MSDILKKLHYKGQDPVLAFEAPEEAQAFISELLAAGPRVDREPHGKYEWLIAFAKTMEQALAVGPTLADALEGDGILWLCYPKGTSKRYPKADLNRDSLWPLLEREGFRPVAQVALDEDWSAMRFRRSTL